MVSVTTALTEITRVLAHDGILIVIDVVAPESALLDTVLQALELTRDISHVRNYRLSEWQRMLRQNGLSEVRRIPGNYRWSLPSWVRRIGTPESRVQALRAVMADLPAKRALICDHRAERVPDRLGLDTAAQRVRSRRCGIPGGMKFRWPASVHHIDLLATQYVQDLLRRRITHDEFGDHQAALPPVRRIVLVQDTMASITGD